MKTWIAAILAVGMFAATAACDDHHDGDEHLFCQGDEDLPAVDLSRLGDQGIFKLVILDWAPDPLFVGNNSLTVLVTDANDTPVDGITFDVAESWQRVHNHGTPVDSVVTPLGNTGEFQIDDLNVLHTGSWLFRFAPTDGVDSDYVVFNFGIECPPD